MHSSGRAGRLVRRRRERQKNARDPETERDSETERDNETARHRETTHKAAAEGRARPVPGQRGHRDLHGAPPRKEERRDPATWIFLWWI